MLKYNLPKKEIQYEENSHRGECFQIQNIHLNQGTIRPPVVQDSIKIKIQVPSFHLINKFI